LTGHEVETVISIEPRDDHWKISVEVVETRRIPDSADILASYEVQLDSTATSCPTNAPTVMREGNCMEAGDGCGWNACVPGRSRPPDHRQESTNLADILERVLDKGIVIAGDIRVNLLDIELLTIKIRLLVASVDKAREMGIDWWEHDPTLSSGQRDLAEENRGLRRGPNWASIGFAQDAEVGVRHSSTLLRSAQARMVGVLFADRLSMIT
jgi:hypothetical protein